MLLLDDKSSKTQYDTSHMSLRGRINNCRVRGRQERDAMVSYAWGGGGGVAPLD